MPNTYIDPVAKLIKLGRPEDPWLDYPGMGLMQEHIPELIRMVEDDEFCWLEPPAGVPEGEDLPDWYAPIHAWRALGQLQAEAAIPALLGLLYQIDEEDDGWLAGDAPRVFAGIGAAAVEPLSAYLAEEENPLFARAAAGNALAEIGKAHPEERQRCIQVIASVLEKYEDNDEGFNGFLIGNLVDLQAVEQIELIKQAFAAEAVDEFIQGDMEDVQIYLGLLEKRLTPERSWQIGPPAQDQEGYIEILPGARNAEKKQKNKRKQEKKSRKKNRKRK